MDIEEIIKALKELQIFYDVESDLFKACDIVIYELEKL